LVDLIKAEITAAYGNNPEKSTDFARIINGKNWKRLALMLKDENILAGGQINESDFYIAPTLIDEPKLDSLAMEDEIFGPILPILSYKNETDLKHIITNYEKPLSLFVFTGNKSFAKKIISNFSFGGGCINDTVIHFANNRLPFGGVGHSGIGAYHGKRSFDVFTHKKAMLKKATWLDIPLRYAPYTGKLKNLKRILKWLS
jgi:aldehyde dehydrogenase (NAD+)